MSLIRKVDCVRLYVQDLEAGLAFYRDRLGHSLIWRTETAAGLRLPELDAELVLQAEDQRHEVDLLVDWADEAAVLIEQAGGKVIVPPFEIQIGRCVVLENPGGNPLVLLDMSKEPPEDGCRWKRTRQYGLNNLGEVYTSPRFVSLR